jgi:Toprim-like
MEILLLQVQLVVVALDADESGQKAASKLAGELQAAGLATTFCVMPQDGYGKDWSERWRRVPEHDGVAPVFEAWMNGYASVELPNVGDSPGEDPV